MRVVLPPILNIAIVAGLLVLLCSKSHAQTACPPGMEEYGAGVCGYSRTDESAQQVPQQQASQQPAPKWSTNWGAIATDGPGGSFGATTDMPNKASAEKMALEDCHAKKGSFSCKVELWYSNACASMVMGDAGHNAKADSTSDLATKSAMKTCSAADTHCHVYYSACSLPVRIQ